VYLAVGTLWYSSFMNTNQTSEEFGDLNYFISLLTFFNITTSPVSPVTLISQELCHSHFLGVHSLVHILLHLATK